MVAAAKATVPTVSDQASAMQLSQCAKNLAAALAELRTAAQKVSNFACGARYQPQGEGAGAEGRRLALSGRLLVPGPAEPGLFPWGGGASLLSGKCGIPGLGRKSPGGGVCR